MINGVFTPRKIDQNNMHDIKPANLQKQLVDYVEFTVLCGRCFKWVYVPAKVIYEKIRIHMLEHPFYSEESHEWRANISTDDTHDVIQLES